MKNSRLVFAIQCSSLWLLIFNFNHVMVSAQSSPLGGLGTVITAILPHIPAKVLGLIQLSLLARLLRQSRTRNALQIGANGIDDDRDGLVDEEDEVMAPSERKKNVMIFLGKHNIQVSNHGVKNEETGECIDGDVCEEVVDENGDEEEEVMNGEDNTNGKDYAYKFKGLSNEGKNSGDITKEEEDEELDSDYTNDYRPMSLSYANSNQKSTQTSPMVPKNKKAMKSMRSPKVPIPMKNMLISVKTKARENQMHEDMKVTDLMSVPKGFPLKSPSSYTLKRNSDFDRKSSSLQREEKNYELSDNDINELLSHPKVIEILRKLNESLSEAEDQGIRKEKAKSKTKNRTKRQVINNQKQSIADEKWRPISLNRLRQAEQLVASNSYPTLTYSLPNNPIHISSQPQESQNTGSNEQNNYSNAEASGGAVLQYETEREPQLSDQNYKSSPSLPMPVYYPMAVTDDDTYPMQLEMTKPDDYGHLGDQIGRKPFVGVSPQYMYGGGHGLAYGHDVNAVKGYEPHLPVIDLTYWTKVNKKNKKKKKKSKKKKKKNKSQYKEQVPEEEYEYEYEDDYEDDYEQYEYEEKPVSKKHATIQVIKSGKSIGNRGTETQELPEWLTRLPGVDDIFGKG